MGGFTYIMASKKYGTLYVGAAEDLIKRVYEHKNDLVEGFTKRYQVHDLVYYEQFDSIEEAKLRELRLKKWNRAWKISLIEGINKEWKDLFESIL